MNRFKRIASRGWLGKSLYVLTFGYFPYRDVALGKVCIGNISMTIPSAAFAMSLPDVSMSMALPAMSAAMSIPATSVSMSVPSVIMKIEDCDV